MCERVGTDLVQIYSVEMQQGRYRFVIDRRQRVEAVNAGNNTFSLNIGKTAGRNLILLTATSLRDQHARGLDVPHGEAEPVADLPQIVACCLHLYSARKGMDDASSAYPCSHYSSQGNFRCSHNLDVIANVLYDEMAKYLCACLYQVRARHFNCVVWFS